ncbi:MAG: hypothetical protein VZQ62_00735 [Methanosphaera sp.]|nr:hypothetical protein [Methanosphaera sp.]
MVLKNGGSVIFNFKGDNKDVKSKLAGLTKNFAETGKLIGKGIVAGTTVAMAGITALVKKSVEAYAEFEQLNGGLEALFGKGSANMQRVTKMSEDAYKNLTMSQNQYLSAFEKSYSIINNGIGKNADAIEYTNKMLSISSDLYNTYGGTVETYQSAINWALKGTYSYLDNLNIGIKGTKEGFIEAANKSGVLNKNIKDTSELTNDEILNVIEYYTKSAGALGRTQKEAGETIQGSMNMMKSSWENLVAGFSKDGANVKKLMKQFINSAGTFVKNILPIIQTAINSILELLPSIIKEITSRLPQAITMIIGTLASMLPTIISLLINLTVSVINALVQALPTLIPQLIDAILTGILTLLDNIDLLVDCGLQLIWGLIKGIFLAIPVLVQKAPQIIIKLVSALVKSLIKIDQFARSIPSRIWNGIKTALPLLISKMPTVIQNAVAKLKEGLTKFRDIGKNIIKGLWQGAKDMKDYVVNKFKGLGKSILGGMKKALGIKSPSKEFAIIGRFSMLGYQEGLEQMQPQIDKAINGMFNLSPSMTGTMNNTLSPKVNVVNNVNVETDPLGQMVSKIKTFSGGAKNDYNYGYGG